MPFCNALLTVGADISEGQYLFYCMETVDNSAQILIFESTESYKAYHSSSRFTVGDEQEAIDANSKASKWINQDESFSTYLNEGNIVIIEGGYMKISRME